MTRHYESAAIVFVFFAMALTPSAYADADENARVVDGAVVGASTQVLGDATLNYVTGSDETTRTPAQKALHRALTGAATGAASASMSQKETKGTVVEPKHPSGSKKSETDSSDVGEASVEEAAFRPPGWDRGQKKGWGDGDRPPGLAKKNKTPPGFHKGNKNK
jgi:hypothetical protein